MRVLHCGMIGLFDVDVDVDVDSDSEKNVRGAGNERLLFCSKNRKYERFHLAPGRHLWPSSTLSTPHLTASRLALSEVSESEVRNPFTGHHPSFIIHHPWAAII